MKRKRLSAFVKCQLKNLPLLQMNYGSIFVVHSSICVRSLTESVVAARKIVSSAHKVHIMRRACHETYPLLPAEEMVAEAKRNADRGVLRFSIVTSGKRLSDREVDEVCNSIREIRENAGIEVCVSFGLLSEEQFRKIKEAGASRVHCNLETSQRFFSKVCTTHTFEEKVETLKAAQRAWIGSLFRWNYGTGGIYGG